MSLHRSVRPLMRRDDALTCNKLRNPPLHDESAVYSTPLSPMRESRKDAGM